MHATGENNSYTYTVFTALWESAEGFLPAATDKKKISIQNGHNISKLI